MNETIPPFAIEVDAVRRVYAAKPAPVVALESIDLRVEPGEFFGLLGPNGAGKTTLIKILTTLLLPSSGRARVFGFDVERDTKKIRRIMNMVAGGEQSGYGILTVREQLWMFTQFYGLTGGDGWRRVDELIEAVGLAEQRLQRVSTLSTGQRQKMNLARGLLNDPWILFLDEPTLGLDVSAARSLRELIVDWKGAVPGRTILITTHYMAEADELCDRIAIVDRGRILAIGSPDELKRRVQRESIFRLELDHLVGGASAIASLPGVVSAKAGRSDQKCLNRVRAPYRQSCIGVAQSGLMQAPHVAAEARNRQQTRLVINQLGELCDIKLHLAHQVQQHAGVKIASACAHDRAAGGCQAHAGINRLSAFDGSHARAIAQVSDHDAIRQIRPKRVHYGFA